MSQPFIGEIRMFAGNFEPAGWLFCKGQLLPIAENDALFSLIGTIYGGDGRSTFALPDLRGRIPIHQGDGFALAQNGGAEAVPLSTDNLPVHNHPLMAAGGLGNNPNPAANVLAESTVASLYQAADPTSAMAPQSVSTIGGTKAHANVQPYLCINFIISLFGIYPSST